MSEIRSAQGPEAEGAVVQLARDEVERKRFLRMAGKSLGGAAAASPLGAFIAASGGRPARRPTQPRPTPRPRQVLPPATRRSWTMPSPRVSRDRLLREGRRQWLVLGVTLSTIKTFGSEEAEHVVALRRVAASLGHPVAEPKFKFPIHSAAQVTHLAATVENLGAAAYLGQAPRIKSTQILAAALSIHPVEGRHAATLNNLLHHSPAPNGAFATPMWMAQVLPIVKPFIVS